MTSAASAAQEEAVVVVEAQQPVTQQSAAPAATPAVTSASGWSNIASYQQLNSDVKGWLKIPGTNIDYPVLFNSYDVNYYLEKDVYKQYSRNGVIWADPATYFGTSSTMSRNTVLYGHNWTNYSATPRITSPSDSVIISRRSTLRGKSPVFIG